MPSAHHSVTRLRRRRSIGKPRSLYTAAALGSAFLAAWRCDTVVVAYDEDLANRIRDIVQDEPGLTEKKMFGGLAFLINGNMAISASGQGGVLVRVDPDETARLVQRAHVARFAMRGREMDGWLRVAPEGLRTKRQLQSWAKRGVDFARSLPPKR